MKVKRGSDGRRVGGLRACFALLLLSPLMVSCLGPLPQRPAGAADWELIGLDVPDYAGRARVKIAAGERAFIRHHKLEVRWERVQPRRGTFDWSYYDGQIDAVLSDGSQSILLLLNGPVPAWARDASHGSFADKAPPADLGDWYAFCREACGRYGSVVDFYEVWNEPGWDRDSEAYRLFGTCHFGGRVETDYLPLLQAAHKAVKEADPDGTVICGALIDTLRDDPRAGTGMYTYLFDASRRPASALSVEAEADSPVTARRALLFSCAIDGAASCGDAAAGTPGETWYFADGCTRPGFSTWISLRNPGEEDAAVALEYWRGDGTGTRGEVKVGARSCVTVNVNCGGTGAGAYDSAAGDVSARVSSDRPVAAERSVYFHSAADASPAALPSPAAAWSLPAARAPSVTERVCLQNPNGEGAAVSLSYVRGDGLEVREEARLGALSRLTVPVDRSGTADGSRTAVSVVSDRPIVAERSLGLDYAGAWSGCSRGGGAASPREEWDLGGGDIACSMRDCVFLRNPGGEAARVDMAYAVEGLQVSSGRLELPPGAWADVETNALCGFGACCDMIAVHPYKMPGNWGPFYAALVEALRSIGVGKELVVTEVGWPHRSDDDPAKFSEGQQADAIGEWGIGPLREAGCRKIWVYKDMDEPPGKSWDKCYYGLFDHRGDPHPSWEEYKRWQQANPGYAALPSSLP